MKMFKRPWLNLSLMAMAIAVFSPNKISAMYLTNIGAMSVAHVATAVQPEPTLVIDEGKIDNHIAPVSFDSRYFDQFGTDQGRLYYTDDHPQSYSMTLIKTNPVKKTTMAESPHFDFMYDVYSENKRNYGNLTLVNVSTDPATSQSSPTFGSADRDHQVVNNIARNYRLAVRVVPLRTCWC